MIYYSTEERLMKKFRDEYPKLSKEDAIEFVMKEIKRMRPRTDHYLEQRREHIKELAGNFYADGFVTN